ncbi:MAG: hypothetical protein ACI4B6_08485 [Atopobiaceae bacterium]
MKKHIAAVLAVLFAALAIATPAFATSYGEQEMYRLYNRWSGEHFYTASASEKDILVGLGWNYEGIGWVAPQTSDTPVYRLYNPYTGDHHYTMSYQEYVECGRQGWSQEGIGWYSDDELRVPLYREFNPYEKVGTHNYTTSYSEHCNLVSIGWRDEGTAWYAVREGTPVTPSQPSQPDNPSNPGGGSTTPDSDVVYITSSGEGRTYHSTPSCESLARAKGVISISKQEAIARGYTPCKRCHH